MADGNRSSYKLVTGRDINVMSAATTQFSGTPDPLPHASTREHHAQYKRSTNNLTTETYIDAISVVLPMF